MSVQDHRDMVVASLARIEEKQDSFQGDLLSFGKENKEIEIRVRKNETDLTRIKTIGGVFSSVFAVALGLIAKLKING